MSAVDSIGGLNEPARRNDPSPTPAPTSSTSSAAGGGSEWHAQPTGSGNGSKPANRDSAAINVASQALDLAARLVSGAHGPQSAASSNSGGGVPSCSGGKNVPGQSPAASPPGGMNNNTVTNNSNSGGTGATTGGGGASSAPSTTGSAGSAPAGSGSTAGTPGQTAPSQPSFEAGLIQAVKDSLAKGSLQPLETYLQQNGKSLDDASKVAKQYGSNLLQPQTPAGAGGTTPPPAPAPPPRHPHFTIPSFENANYSNPPTHPGKPY